MSKIMEILGEQEGVILRHIPKRTRYVLEAKHCKPEHGDILVFLPDYNRMMTVGYEENNAGGKWLAMIQKDGGATTNWSAKTFVIGDTPEQALELLLAKLNKE